MHRNHARTEVLNLRMALSDLRVEVAGLVAAFRRE
jgi:hypothetical protein